MDLLEYQGKQLFAKHGVPVPDGRPATTVPEAGGIKLANDRHEALEAKGVRVGRNPTQVSEIAEEILGARV